MSQPERNPSIAAMWNQRGIEALKQGDVRQAVDCLQQAVNADPVAPALLAMLGRALERAGDLDRAAENYRRAVQLAPTFLEAWNDLAIVLRLLGRFEEAIDACQRVLIKDPNSAQAHFTLGSCCKSLGRWPEAISELRAVIQLQPSASEAHFLLGMCLLATGQFAQGWTEYEWRWKWKSFADQRMRFDLPRWDGSPLDGKTILIHAEQGLGDTIMFVRFIPMVAQRGGRVLLFCQPNLTELLGSAPGLTQAFSWIPAPPADLECPLQSLPLVFQTDQNTIPSAVPYLHADPERVRHWQRQLQHDGRFKVGLVWAGGPKHPHDAVRSMHLQDLTALASVRTVSFYSLQKGPAAEQLRQPPAGLSIVDHTAELQDFSDTAALMANLDLIICVDTAVAHLAGAMALPVWTLLPIPSDWRWQQERQESPWYPSMRLIRQNAPGDWKSLVEKVADDLAQLGA